jgi:putative heme-binding domain-containing protein
MRTFLLTLTCLVLAAVAPAKSAEPFEIKDGDRVLFLGDTLLEREGTYGYLETRMAEQFPDRKFTVRNLAFSADTPLGWSRASFDPPAKGFERLKEQLALVQPTVVFLGYGMAASLQEMTDRSQDWTLNRDPARYGAEPMSAARFKKELAQCMDAIAESGRAGFQPAVPGILPGTSNVGKPAQRDTPSGNERKPTPDAPGKIPGAAGGTPALPEANPVRFVLLSPIRHEDVRTHEDPRQAHPGTPDPTEHNKLLEQYSKAIEELAQERGARFVSLATLATDGPIVGYSVSGRPRQMPFITDNGIHLSERGYMNFDYGVSFRLGWGTAAEHFNFPDLTTPPKQSMFTDGKLESIRHAIIRKNALFFHRWRPANETYLFGFRKREQGQNAVEIPKFDPLIEAAEAEIERLKRAPKGADAAPITDGLAAVTGRGEVVTGRDGSDSTAIGVVTGRGGVVTGRDGSDSTGIEVVTGRGGAVTGRDGSDSTGIEAVTGRGGVVTSRDGSDSTGIEVVTGRGGVVTGRDGSDSTGIEAVTGGERADFQQKTPVLTSTGQLYAANDTPATAPKGGDATPGAKGTTGAKDKDGHVPFGIGIPNVRDGNQPPVTSHQSPVTAAPDARQTPAETPDLSKVAASPSTLPLPDFTLADGLEITLWAENPLLAKPTECNWDAQGRLWVASSALYPMIAPGQAATDKIIIIEDPGHTGKATKATVFVDGLLIPTGVAPVLVQDEGTVGSAKNSEGDKPRAMLIPIAPRDASVKVLSHKAYKAVISGKVARPGPQFFTDANPLKLSEAIINAKSTPFSDLRKVRLTRGGQSVEYNVEKILKEGRKDLDVPLQDGDVIYVPPVRIDFQNPQAPQPPVPPAPDSQVPVPPSRSPQVPKTPSPSSPSPQVSQSPRPPRWACYVGQSTELLYFEDTDGDGKADTKRIVFSGFGTEDTHHIVHTLRWGPDGRLYFSQSVYIHTHMETPWGVVRVNSGGVFAYDPRTERVEVVEKGLWNTWGHAWDQWGQSFYTDGAGSTGLSWGFPGATFAPNEGARRTMASISPGSYPKFAGLELIYSPHFPAEWQGSAVTCDFRAHKIVHFKISDLGFQISDLGKPAENSNASSPTNAAPNQKSESQTEPGRRREAQIRNQKSEPKSGYITEQLPVLVQTSDATFRPIDVKLGPDGALYIADWSNPIINHGEVDFRDPRRDHEHGRIWRLSRKGGAAVKWESLVGKKTEELFPKLLSKNLWEREQSKTVLVSSLNDETRFRAVYGFQNDLSGSQSQRPLLAPGPVELAALQIYEAGHDCHGVTIAGSFSRRLWDVPDPLQCAAARYIGENQLLLQSMRESFATLPSGTEDERRLRQIWKLNFELALDPMAALEDLSKSKPRVRLEAMRALARMPDIKSASLILDAAINAPKDDPQYEFAAWLSINDLAEVWTEAVLAGKWKIEGREKQLEFALDALDAARSGPVIAALLKQRPITRDGAGPWIELIGKGGGKAELQQLFARVAKGDLEPPALVRAMNALADAARLRNLRPDGDVAMVTTLIDAIHPDTRTAAARLAGLWKISEAAPRLEALAKNADGAERAAAFEGLRSLGGAPAVAVLEKLVRSENPSVPPAALAALAQLKPAAAIAEIPAVLGAIKSEPELLATWRGIFQSKAAVDQLSANFPANLPKPAITAALRAARELGRPGLRLVARLTPRGGESAAVIIPADFTDLAARAKKDGDPVAGEAIYRRMASACTTCHAIGGAGGKLGPDMTSIGASAPPDYIIESILNPAAKVKEGYHAFSFTMKDGTEAIGIPSRETPQEQFIRTLAGEQGLPKANIVSKKIAEGGASLMPVGLTAAWTDRERLNLYAFLMELGRPGPFDASKNNVARVWMLTDSEKVDGALKVETPASTPSTASIPSIPAYTLVDGRLTKDLLAEKLAILQPKNAAVHLTARFQAATAGKAKLNLTGIRKAWLDDQPLAIASEPSPSVELTAGAHTFTVEVDAKSPPDVLRLESPAVSFLGD